MKKLVLSILAVLAIVTAVAGCESGHKTTVIPTPEPTVAPMDTPTPTPVPTQEPTPTPTPVSSAMEIEGTWTGQANNGTLNITYTFSDSSWTVTDTNIETLQSIEMSGTFTIDTSANPKLIDLYIAASSLPDFVGATMFGLYEVSSSSLLLTYNSSNEERPTDFTEAITYVKQ